METHPRSLMSRLAAMAAVADLIKRWNELGFKPGSTHVQKAVYLLRDLWRVPFPYEFCLYHHGPYSFDLAEDLSSFEVTGVIDKEERGKGAVWMSITQDGSKFIENVYRSYKVDSQKIASALEALNGKSASELVLLATTQYVISSGVTEPMLIAQEVHEIKPQYTVAQALEAVDNLQLLHS